MSIPSISQATTTLDQEVIPNSSLPIALSPYVQVAVEHIDKEVASLLHTQESYPFEKIVNNATIVQIYQASSYLVNFCLDLIKDIDKHQEEALYKHIFYVYNALFFLTNALCPISTNHYSKLFPSALSSVTQKIAQLMALGYPMYKSKRLIPQGCTSKVVCVKIKDIRMAIKKISCKEWFYNEIENAHLIDHEHIVEYVWKSQQDQAIGFRWYANGALDEVMNASFDQAQKTGSPVSFPYNRDQIVFEVLIALEYLHEKNIIHRDIKLDNIFLDENYHAYLADFGFAQKLNQEEKKIPLWGAPAYAPPESFYKEKITPKSDMFSLGCQLYTLYALEPYLKIEKIKTVIENFNEPSRPCFVSHPLNKTLAIPDVGKNEEMTSLIINMLSPEPEKRPDSHEALKSPFFSDQLECYLKDNRHSSLSGASPTSPLDSPIIENHHSQIIQPVPLFPSLPLAKKQKRS